MLLDPTALHGKATEGDLKRADLVSVVRERPVERQPVRRAQVKAEPLERALPRSECALLRELRWHVQG